MEYVEIARATSPRGELVLRERRSETGPTSLELRVNGVFVMDTVETGTEQTLATAGLAAVSSPEEVLIGGLGLGFTMHAVLGDNRVQRCRVVEIEQALVDWLRAGTVPHGPHFLADERVEVVVGDVAQVLTETPAASYDLILLDVDNGPDQLVHEQNAGLYDEPFLRVTRRALRDDGALVIWSAAESRTLLDGLAAEFDIAEGSAYEVLLQGRDEHYWLYLARVASPE